MAEGGQLFISRTKASTSQSLFKRPKGPFLVSVRGPVAYLSLAVGAADGDRRPSHGRERRAGVGGSESRRRGGEPSALSASFLWLSSHSATSNHTDALLNFLILHNQEWGFFHLTDDCTAAALLLFLPSLFAFPICILIQLWKPPYGSQSGCSSPSLPVNVIVSLTATGFHKKRSEKLHLVLADRSSCLPDPLLDPFLGYYS